jgi:hypothetical protein
MLHLSTEIYPQCGDVVVICKIVFVEDDRLKTDVCFANSDMDTIDDHEVLRKTLGWDNPSSREIFCEPFHDPRSTATIMASSLAGVLTVCERPAFTRVLFQ